MTVEILAIGAHPDDIELTIGGSVARFTAQGYRVGILDSTEGELGSRGSVQERRAEAEAASKVLGVAVRKNLALPDGGLNPFDEKQVLAAVQALRELRPQLALIPFFEERHVDHVAASRLYERAIFLAGLKEFHPELGSSHSTRSTLYYQMRAEFRPSFIVDTSPYFETKKRAYSCFSSQVAPADDALKQGVLIASQLNLPALEARDRHCGGMIGVEYGEPFFSREMVTINDPLQHFSSTPRPLFFPPI